MEGVSWETAEAMKFRHSAFLSCRDTLQTCSIGRVAFRWVSRFEKLCPCMRSRGVWRPCILRDAWGNMP